MEKIDVAIIGGGVIGLAVAGEIAGSSKDIFIFENPQEKSEGKTWLKQSFWFQL